MPTRGGPNGEIEGDEQTSDYVRYNNASKSNQEIDDENDDEAQSNLLASQSTSWLKLLQDQTDEDQ